MLWRDRRVWRRGARREKDKKGFARRKKKTEKKGGKRGGGRSEESEKIGGKEDRIKHRAKAGLGII